jgi:hypothetical protein
MKKIYKSLAIVILLCGLSQAQGFPPKYHTYAEAVAELQALQAAHPTICSLDSIGYSNRDSLIMYAFKISDNVSVEEDEPAILFEGGVHADEILGPEIIIAFCNDIVSKYATGDTAVVRYVNSYEIFCVPFVNPEGHTVVEGGDMDWRKNKTDNNLNGILDYQDGVDNNRNYDFGWSIDTTPGGLTPESLMYKGPYPFSESENRCLAAFGLKYKPLIGVDYHSPTYGRAEKVYYDWYWYPSQGGHGMAPDEGSMHNIAIGFAASVVNDQGDSSYEARRGLVQQGDFKSYFYGNFGTAAFTCEVSDTTIQDTSLVDSICRRNVVGMYYLLRRSGYARLTGVATDSINGLPLEAEVEVQQATSVDIHTRYTRPNTGRYDRLIDPGTYTLIFRKTGYVSKTITGVVVNNSSPTVTNVRLRPNNPPPGTPVLGSPPNAYAFVDSTSLNFDWGDVSGATGYVIEISPNSGFSSYFEFDSTDASSSYRNITPFNSGLYYWRVTAYNTNGYSSRSTVWQFTITRNLPPSAPTLFYPNDGYQADSIHLTLDWNEPSGATGYILEISNNQNFTSYFEFDSTLALSNYRNISAFIPGTYYWRVTADNAYGYSSRSSVRHFIITGGQVPAPPTLLSPGDGLLSSSAFITFDWSDVSGGTRYEIQIDTDNQFSPPLISDSTLLTSGYQNTDSFPNATYYWRARVRNNNGWSNYSDIWSFAVEVDSGLAYIIGDVNHSGTANGIDVGYLVNYFKGGPPPPLVINGFYPEADVNGNCTVNGLDVTYLVNYFKGGSALIDGNCLR